MGNIFKYNAKAGILSLVLSFSLMVAVLCTALIMGAYYFNLASVKTSLSQKLNRNARSGLDYLLAEIDNLDYQKPYIFDLFGEGRDSIQLHKKPWGLLQIGVSKAFSGKHIRNVAVLTGAVPNPFGKASLYLTDERRPLSIAGDTEIKGNVYLPKAGVKTTYINRIGYSGKELVKGSVYESKAKLPSLNKEIMADTEALINKSVRFSNYFLTPIKYLPDSLFHSFYQEESLYYYSPGPVQIKHYLKGNIIIQSGSEIIIDSQSNLEGILILAPKVYIGTGFKGSVQVFASDSILVNKNSQLNYPSVLGILGNQAGSFMELKAGSTLHGIAFMKGQNDGLTKDLFKIHKDARIIGQAYINGMVEHEGEIWGSLSCRKFLLKTSSTIYENHLFNAVLDNSKLSKNYLGSSLWAASEKRGIVKWLE